MNNSYDTPEFTTISSDTREYYFQKMLSISSWEESFLVEEPSEDKLYVMTRLLKDKILNWFRDNVHGEKSEEETERAALKKFEMFDNNFQIRAQRLVGVFPHPNVARYHAVEYDRNNKQHFALMEYIPGTNLYDETRGMLIQYIIALAVQILKGLDYLHRLGILHLKLKPDNIYTLRDGKKLGAKLINAGFMVSINDARESKQVGPAPYVSPEMVLGGKIDERADLFMFAAVIYHILSGDVPFPKRHVKKPDVLPKLKEIIKRENLPPRLHNVPEELNDLILNLLNKDPLERNYETANSVIQAILEIYPEADLEIQRSKKSIIVSVSQKSGVLEDEASIIIDNINDLDEL
ncbi:protein kinase [bacterium]|nr:protein kinase [bacterium]